MSTRLLLGRPSHHLCSLHSRYSTRRASFRTCQANSQMAPPLSTVPHIGQGRVLSIQSHTVQGYVGNKAAVFPLQLLGFDVDPINSVQFSNHTDVVKDYDCGRINCTGYPVWRGQVLNGEELWSLIEGLEANDLLYYTHLLTGYIGSLSFLECVIQVVEKLRSVNPDLIYVCDPVMGDEGTFYIPPNLVPVYSEKVLQLASIVTPNQFEAEKLTGCSIKTEADALHACKLLHAAGPSKVIITSLELNGSLLLIGSSSRSQDEAPEQFRITMSKIPEYFTGTGDLMTALILGWSHKYPNDLEKATELAVSSLQSVLKRTVADYLAANIRPCVKQLELRLIQCQDEIKSPQVTHLAERYT